MSDYGRVRASAFKLTALEGAAPPDGGNKRVVESAGDLRQPETPPVLHTSVIGTRQEWHARTLRGEMANVLKCLRQIRKYIQIEEKATRPRFAVL